MRIILATAILATALVALPSSQTSQDSRPSSSLERAFTSNGRISFDLSAGEYRITGSRDTRLRMKWSVRDPEDLSKVFAKADVHGSEANVTTDGPDNFKAEIQVPARADLYVRLTAGELTIEGIQGNKDVSLHAGELDIDVGRADDYHSVAASVWAGEVHATPFHVSKEGLFRSFNWSGKGPYSLEARLKAGEVHLRSRGDSAR
jgi:hypothetical protein